MISPLYFEACGIDISDRAVKYVSLLHKRHGFELASYGEYYLPEGTINGGVIANAAALIEVLKKVRVEVGLDYAVASLPEEKGYVVEMLVPANLDADKVREAVELHLEERVPIAISGAVFDYEDSTIATGPQDQSILVTSVVETTVADGYYQSLKAAGLRPITFELESQSLARAAIKEGTKDVSMIVDIGREQSNLSIVSGQVVHVAASINVGGAALAKAIEDDLHVSKEEAKKLKEEVGLLRKNDGKSPFGSIVRVASVLRDEIWQRLSYWNNGDASLGKRNPIARVLLCGGNANIPGLAEYLTSDMGLPVALVNPWINMASFDDYIPSMTKSESLKYCTALGLALRASSGL